MTTESQVTANRANAKKSTGPRTITGKARSGWFGWFLCLLVNPASWRVQGGRAGRSCFDAKPT